MAITCVTHELIAEATGHRNTLESVSLCKNLLNNGVDIAACCAVWLSVHAQLRYVEKVSELLMIYRE